MGADFQIAHKSLTEKDEAHKTGNSWVNLDINDQICVDRSNSNNNKQNVCIVLSPVLVWISDWDNNAHLKSLFIVVSEFKFSFFLRILRGEKVRIVRQMSNFLGWQCYTSDIKVRARQKQSFEGKTCLFFLTNRVFLILNGIPMTQINSSRESRAWEAQQALNSLTYWICVCSAGRGATAHWGTTLTGQPGPQLADRSFPSLLRGGRGQSRAAQRSLNDCGSHRSTVAVVGETTAGRVTPDRMWLAKAKLKHSLCAGLTPTGSDFSEELPNVHRTLAHSALRAAHCHKNNCLVTVSLDSSFSNVWVSCVQPNFVLWSVPVH